ncbi:MAG: GTP pyrophosphokinase [Phototrophicaceae bacterium]
MPTIEDAIELALQAHRGALQKNGQPYILHPLTLMTRFHDEAGQMVAVLHDVVEDTPITLDDLVIRGYSAEVVNAVEALTRRLDESYTAFIERISKNPLATRVKLADLEHNMDVRRLPGVTENDLSRLEQYRQAWFFLQGKLT